MPTCAKKSAAIFLLLLLASFSASAYEYPLSSSSIRKAYFLGQRDDQETAKFLARYVRRLPEPASGPYVSEIKISTPYRQMILRGRQNIPGDSEVQAESDASLHPASFFVRVRIELTPTYSNFKDNKPRSVNFWRSFSVHFIQGKEIEPQRVSGRPLYHSERSGGALYGAVMQLTYDAASISSAPARVEVRTPDGRLVKAAFDLSRLR